MFTNKSGRCPERHPKLGARCVKSAAHADDHQIRTGEFVYRWGWRQVESFDDPGGAIKKNEESRRRVGAIPSWRWWKIANRGILKSISSGTEWHTPVMTTKRLSDGSLARVAPKNPLAHRSILTPRTDWGVYSYKTPALLRRFDPNLFAGRYRGAQEHLALGRIDNLGHVVEHEYGYRAQRVIIREIWVFYKDSSLEFQTAWRKATERRYECKLNLVPWRQLDHWVDFYSDESMETNNE